MRNCKSTVLLLKISGVVILLTIFYYVYLSNDFVKGHIEKLTSVKLPLIQTNKHNNYNVWLIFTKVGENSPLKYKFRNLLENLLKVSSVNINFNIIIDEKSRTIAEKQMWEASGKTNRTLLHNFYNLEECATKIKEIVDVMTPHFSSKPGTYYSGALFYISLGLYQIAPLEQDTAILLDCDLYFKKDITLLFEEFNKFKPTAMFGLAPELTPVYHHILHTYKSKHNTTFGDYYHENIIRKGAPHPRGFQGYNSGVVLINLKKIRENLQKFQKAVSNETVQALTYKYKFRGHLGDQDFYTLIGYEYPSLIQTIACGFNRQLCTWWRDHGYSDVFGNYFKCKGAVVVLHGNCNTRIPKE